MRNLVVCAAVVLFTAASADAQVVNPRFFISVNGGIQPSRGDLSDHFEFEQHVETARVDVAYPIEQATIFDGGVAVRLWKQLGAGVAFSGYSRDGSATVTAEIPHPFFFNRPRTIEGEVNSLTRTESAIHIQAVYIVPSSSRLRLLLSAGPSRIETEQAIVTAIQYDESFPFDTATFRGATTRSFKASKVGFNVGVDASYMFLRNIGVGALVRYASADIDTDGPDNRRIALKSGGLQAGGGIRFGF